MRFLIILLVSLGVTSGAYAADMGPTITVIGHGDVAATPDMATVSLGVTQEAKTASAAMSELSGSMAQILSALKSAGIDDSDLQTGELSIEPLGGKPKIRFGKSLFDRRFRDPQKV